MGALSIGQYGGASVLSPERWLGRRGPAASWGAPRPATLSCRSLSYHRASASRIPWVVPRPWVVTPPPFTGHRLRHGGGGYSHPRRSREHGNGTAVADPGGRTEAGERTETRGTRPPQPPGPPPKTDRSFIRKLSPGDGRGVRGGGSGPLSITLARMTGCLRSVGKGGYFLQAGSCRSAHLRGCPGAQLSRLQLV